MTNRERALEWLDEDDALFVEMVEELDGCIGFAENYRCYPMNELGSCYSDRSVTDFINDLTPNFNIDEAYFLMSPWGLMSTNNRVEMYRLRTNPEEVLNNLIEQYGLPELWFTNLEFEDLIKEISEGGSDDEFTG